MLNVINACKLPILEVHTSDRIAFRRCRRKWALSSNLRLNQCLIGGEVSPHLWFGSGIHFALEDHHGHNLYKDPFKAFQAFVYATRKKHPIEIQELIPLAKGMLEHYRYWISKRDDMRTLIFEDGSPAVEINWHVRLPFEGPNGEPVTYSGTFDRLVLDDYDRIWILDYKTAQRFNTSKLEMDPQCSAYMWAFRQLYGVDAEGVVYIQMLKDVPEAPYILKNGEVSTNKAQNTTYALYKRTLIEVYGNSIQRIPPKCMEFAAYLASLETSEGDKFIRRDLVRRSPSHTDAEEWKIYAETKDMLDAQLPMYPNPTRDCGWDCDFRGICIGLDDGSDAAGMLSNGYAPRREMHPWRDLLPTPDQLDAILQGKSPDSGSIEGFRVE